VERLYGARTLRARRVETQPAAPLGVRYSSPPNFEASGADRREETTHVAINRSTSRQWLDRRFDDVMFVLDNFPRSDYHPLDSRAKGARRSEGTLSRWHEILRLVEPTTAVSSALDIGCNGGFFVVNLAKRGIPVIGVDREPKLLRTTATSLRRAGCHNAGVLGLDLRPDTLELLPSVDMVLFLSVWHHLVKMYGIDEADSMLALIWSRAELVMFFDSGEAEMPESWGLPALDPDPATWYADHLAGTCADSTVIPVGRHQAFGPTGTPCQRTLFAVVRSSHSASADVIERLRAHSPTAG